MAQKMPILFLHIPKTAGLTIVHSLLPRLYRPDEIFSTKFTCLAKEDDDHGIGVLDAKLNSAGLFSGTRRPNDLWYPHSLEMVKTFFLRKTAEEQAQVRLIHGAHIVFGLHEFLSRPLSYFTLLRAPVNRVISHYYYSPYAQHERLPLDDPGVLEHLATHVEANLQTRLLAGPQDPEAPLSPEEMLRRARENLRACAVVGLTERFDETLLLLKREYGWPMPYYESRNVNKNRPRREAAPAHLLRRIEADNQSDLALYALALELFDAQVRRYGPTFQRDLARFRAQNHRWQRWRKARTWVLGLPALAGRYTVDPAYEALARWGGLRRLVPARFSPKVSRSLENGRLYIDLKMGQRRVGIFDPKKGRWEIRRPYHLLLDEQALPLSKGLDRPVHPSKTAATAR